MKFSAKLFQFSLWWAVIGASIWMGGTVYMMCVINPQWSRHPPESVLYFFTHTEFNAYIWNFFGPPFMVLRSALPQLLALVLGWKYMPYRRQLLVTFSCTVLTIIFTLVYIYPINQILMVQAGQNHPPEIIARLCSKWILFDRIRFVINVIGFFFLLSVFRSPVALPAKN